MSEPISSPVRPAASAAAGGAAGDAGPIVGIAGDAVNVVVALKIRKQQGHIGFAEHHRTCALQLLDSLGVLPGQVAAPVRIAPGGRRPGEIEGFLQSHGHAVQRPQCGPGSHRPIRRPRLFQRLLALDHHQGVQVAVAAIHPFQIVAQHFFAAEFSAANLAGDGGGGEKGKLAHGRSRNLWAKRS